MAEETERDVFVRGRVPEGVRARFKATCALRGQDMGEVLGDIILKWLEEYEPNALPARKKTTASAKAKRSNDSKVASS